MKGSVAFLMTLVMLFALLNPTALGAASPTDPLTIPAEQLTKTDLARYFELALAEKVTLEQAIQFMAQLNPTQMQWFREITDEIAARNKKAAGGKLSEASGSVRPTVNASTASLSSFLWQQAIEIKWTALGGVSFDYYWADYYTCDDDPDVDYILHYNIRYSYNPNSLRYATTAAVYSYIAAAYGGTLNGFSWSWDDAHMCIGDNMVWTFGIGYLGYALRMTT